MTDIELENKIDLIRVMIVEDESIPATYLKNIIEEQGDFAVECIVPSE